MPNDPSWITQIRTLVAADDFPTPLRRDNSLGALYGTVQYPNGDPAPNAQVTVQDISITTNAAGSFTMPIPFNKQLKTQRVTAFKQGFQVWEFDSPVIQGVSLSIVLKSKTPK